MKNILVVDDDLLLGELFTMTLELEGYYAMSVSDGLQAKQAIKETQWDLIILDLSMPIMDGLILLENLKKENLLHAHIIVLSGMADTKREYALTELGVSAVLQKPIGMDVLIHRVASLI